MSLPRYHAMPENAQQLLPKEAYTSEDWLERERKTLFSNAWTFAGITSDLKEPGDYFTLTVGTYPLVVLLDKDGALRAFHNICRHRGTELLEGRGNAGKMLTCPYHRWVYNLDGSLRGVPNKSDCFPDLKREDMSLFEASIGFFKDFIFVHPSASPDEPFDYWLQDLESVAWPHDIHASDMEMSDEIVYEMKCNWKVFFENAIDGYHLVYLHEHTLGGPKPSLNVWDAHGRHLVWYSTERDGVKASIPEFVEKQADKYRTKKVKGAEHGRYGGVYMFFPTTIIVPTAYSLSLSQLVPVSAGVTLMKTRVWQPKSMFNSRLRDIPGYNKETGVVSSDNWTKHPLETGDFQTEDVWICEKVQRAMQSPAYKISDLANGAGAESPITFFQKNILDFTG